MSTSTIQPQTRTSKRIRKTNIRFDPSWDKPTKKSKNTLKSSRRPKKRKDTNILKEHKRSEYLDVNDGDKEYDLQLPLNSKIGFNHNYYFVEDIINRRKKKNSSWEFKLQKLGWDSKFDEWTPFNQLKYYARRIVYERYTKITLGRDYNDLFDHQ